MWGWLSSAADFVKDTAKKAWKKAHKTMNEHPIWFGLGVGVVGGVVVACLAVGIPLLVGVEMTVGVALKITVGCVLGCAAVGTLAGIALNEHQKANKAEERQREAVLAQELAANQAELEEERQESNAVKQENDTLRNRVAAAQEEQQNRQEVEQQANDEPVIIEPVHEETAPPSPESSDDDEGGGAPPYCGLSFYPKLSDLMPVAVEEGNSVLSSGM